MAPPLLKLHCLPTLILFGPRELVAGDLRLAALGQSSHSPTYRRMNGSQYLEKSYPRVRCTPDNYAHCTLSFDVSHSMVEGFAWAARQDDKAFYCDPYGSCRCCTNNVCGTKTECREVVDEIRRPLEYLFLGSRIIGYFLCLSCGCMGCFLFVSKRRNASGQQSGDQSSPRSSPRASVAPLAPAPLPAVPLPAAPLPEAPLSRETAAVAEEEFAADPSAIEEEATTGPGAREDSQASDLEASALPGDEFTEAAAVLRSCQRVPGSVTAPSVGAAERMQTSSPPRLLLNSHEVRAFPETGLPETRPMHLTGL